MGLILIAIILWSSAASAQELPIPPDVSTVYDTSCMIRVQSDGTWKTTAIAKYANPENHNAGAPFIAVLSVRPHLKEAAADCETWMTAVKARQKEFRERFSKKKQ